MRGFSNRRLTELPGTDVTVIHHDETNSTRDLSLCSDVSRFFARMRNILVQVEQREDSLEKTCRSQFHVA